jgi:hypothetical protein
MSDRGKSNHGASEGMNRLWVKRLETSTHWPRIAGPVGLAGDRGPWAALFNYWPPRKQKAHQMAGQSFWVGVGV